MDSSASKRRRAPMTSVVVFDYGFGNVRSMVRALANLDLDVTLTSDHRQALEADGLVGAGCGRVRRMHGRTEKRRRRQGHQRPSARRPPGARRLRGRADHVRTWHGTWRRHARSRSDQGRCRAARRRRGAAHGLGHRRSAGRFRAAQGRGGRTILFRALLLPR